MNDVRNKIILVDDIISNLDQGRNILKPFYEVYPASSAAKMFAYLEKFVPDLILMDIEMPEMNGYEAIVKLKEDERYADIPVIFLTAKSDEESEHDGFDLGAADYVKKPFSAKLLLKRIENQLLIAQQKADLAAALNVAKNASRAKSNFLANMSHEIRTPLGAIAGMTKIASKTDNIEKLRYCLSNIEASSMHLLGIINDILDVSKIEAGKLDLYHTSFSLDKMTLKVYSLIAEKVESKQIKFNIFLGTGMDVYYVGDELRLSQVITNLLSNAVKFTPANGKIVLSAGETEKTDDYCVLRFSVKDTGIGISEEQRGRLFTAYEQAKSSTTYNFGGTGLGLSISKSIVEQMGGAIWIESEVGKGSEFIFTVKLQRSEERKDALLADNIEPTAVKLLAALADADERAYFTSVVGSFGITHVDEAANTAQAIALAATAREKDKRPYDIIFADCALTDEKDGEQLKNENIIVVAAFLNWNKSEQVLKNPGIRDFILRPLLPSVILGSINKAIGEGGKGVKDIEPKTIKTPDFSDISLLLAEDTEINRDIFISLLEETRLQIVTAENGRIAVDKFKSDPDSYDLIIMDVQMPEMDGYEATKAIRALGSERAKKIPIIAMTASVQKDDIQMGLDCGMNDYLTKPIDVDMVVEKIRRYQYLSG